MHHVTWQLLCGHVKENFLGIDFIHRNMVGRAFNSAVSEDCNANTSQNVHDCFCFHNQQLFKSLFPGRYLPWYYN